jgi:hypothetical protein
MSKFHTQIEPQIANIAFKNLEEFMFANGIAFKRKFRGDGIRAMLAIKQSSACSLLTVAFLHGLLFNCQR